MFPVKTFVATSLGLLVAFSALARDVVIDVRTAQEFQAGHIDGALNISHTDIAQDIFKAKVNKDDHVILYCRSGRRSGLAMDTLKGMGFSNAENYGGLEEAKKRLQKL
jgi:phage shock protein E